MWEMGRYFFGGMGDGPKGRLLVAQRCANIPSRLAGISVTGRALSAIRYPYALLGVPTAAVSILSLECLDTASCIVRDIASRRVDDSELLPLCPVVTPKHPKPPMKRQIPNLKVTLARKSQSPKIH